MKSKKAVLIASTIVMLVLIFVANPAVAETRDLDLAMVLWRGETQAEKGFKDNLKKMGYQVSYTIYNAGNKRNEFAKTLATINFNQFDYVYTFGTSASQLTKVLLDNRVPHIFNAVTAPVKSNIVDSMNSTGGNISGVGHNFHVKLQIKNARNVHKFTRLAYLFNPRESNSKVIRTNLMKLGKDLNFQLVSLRCAPDTPMLKDNLSKLVSKSIDVDAVYLPADSYIVSSASMIVSQLNTAKIVSIGAIREYIDHGALLGTVGDYYELGRLAATVLDTHQKGIPLQNIPVQLQGKFLFVINKTTADMLSIKIDRRMLDKAIFVK